MAMVTIPSKLNEMGVEPISYAASEVVEFDVDVEGVGDGEGDGEGDVEDVGDGEGNGDGEGEDDGSGDGEEPASENEDVHVISSPIIAHLPLAVV